MTNIVNKALVSVVFSNYPTLTLQVRDLAEEMAALSFEDDFSNRLRGAAQSVASPNPYSVATLTVRVLTISTQCQALIDQCRASNILDGIITFTEPAKMKFTLSNVELMFKEVSGDGQQAFIEFTFRGDYQINRELII